MIEEGIIVESENSTAKVKILSGQGCSSCGCGSNGSCHSEKPEGRFIQAENRAKGKVGDRVLLEIDSGTILKSSFIAYMVPIIFLFVGGAIGGWVSARFPEMGNTDTLASIFAMLFFAISILILYFLNKKPESVGDFRPVIKAILR